MEQRGYRLPVKFLRSLAFVIASRRCFNFQVASEETAIQPPGKNWLQSYYKRHPELKAIKSQGLAALRSHIQQHVPHDHPEKAHIEKMCNAARKVFADRTLLLDEIQLLFQQNKKKTVRSTRTTAAIGHAKVMTYDDIQRPKRSETSSQKRERTVARRRRRLYQRPSCKRRKGAATRSRRWRSRIIVRFCSSERRRDIVIC